MDMQQTFAGKHIFITGGTGFLGKVFIWKIMKEFPDLGSLTLLIRPKKGQTPLARIEKDVFSSACFDGIKKELGPEEWGRRHGKVRAVAGDMMSDKLGISDSDYSSLMQQTTHIVHLAATVDFQERLDISVKMNVLGTLRVIALAQKCPKLEGVIHVSTCYVNYNRHSRAGVPVKEQTYALPFDPEGMCKRILSLHPKQIVALTPGILAKYGFPNTYTFTKCMAEQIVERRKGKLPFAILRPSIVGCAHSEPYVGWVDVLTAAGGIFLTAGLGILREINCHGDSLADVVPVDFVVNQTIKVLYQLSVHYGPHRNLAVAGPAAAKPSTTSNRVAIASGSATATTESTKDGGASAFPSLRNDGGGADAPSGASDVPAVDSVNSADGNIPPPMPVIFHSSTTASMNPLQWRTCMYSVREYLKSHKHPKAIHDFDCVVVDSRLQFLIRFYTRRVIPFHIYNTVAKLPVIGSAEKQALLKKYEKAIWRVRDLDKQFLPFTTVQWIFDNTNARWLEEGLNDKDRKSFNSDLYEINWWYYCQSYSYGLVRYLMKIDDGRGPPVHPPSGSEVFLKAAL